MDWSEYEECEGREVCQPCDGGPFRFDPLDIEYTVSSRGDVLGISLLLGFGGPNISLDIRGRHGLLKGSWGFSTDRLELAEDFSDVLNYYAEMFEASR